ncbi:hypothetical protein [Brassicibacter mesophilus]|uniref:hypothetical protein n=1 Tax=Brassicibacter mesophilus TaxID=745119 RepID=UPI003D1CACDC
MDRIKIEVSELNKLYDEIYYTSLEGIEQALEVISSIISEKEFEDSGYSVSVFSDIVDSIIKILDETAEVMDSEELYDVGNFIREKADRIHAGELDDVIESNYMNCSDDDEYDDYDDEDTYDTSNEDYDEFEDYDDY